MSEIVDTIIAPDSQRKVEILRRDDGLFQILAYRSLRDQNDGYGVTETFWSEVKMPVTITDSLLRAGELAQEFFQQYR